MNRIILVLDFIRLFSREIHMYFLLIQDKQELLLKQESLFRNKKAWYPEEAGDTRQ